jgi:hypothetical protein
VSCGPRCAREDGAIAVMSALLMGVLILMSAYVLDLAQLRVDAAQSQTAADLAVTAAVSAFDPAAGGTYRDACERALEYARANLPGAGALSAVHSCAEAFSASYTCDPTAPEIATYDDDNYVVQIVGPVPDSGVVPGFPDLMASLDHGPEYDGLPCDRLGISITRERAYLLARVAGFTRGETTRSAVAKWAPLSSQGVYPSLIVLERQGCGVIKASGQGRVAVTNATIEDVEYPGLITVDTRTPPDCSGTDKHVISVSGEQNASITAEGGISSYALQRADPVHLVYDAQRVAQGRLWEQPRGGRIVTRSPIDHRFNCITADEGGYPAGAGAARWSPRSTAAGVVAQPIEPCEADHPAHVRALHQALQGLAASALPPPDLPGEWSVFPRDVPGATCKAAKGTLGPEHTKPAGRDGKRWYVDCAASGSAVFNPEALTFEGVEYVVVRNGIGIGSSDRLSVNGDLTNGAVVYLQGAETAGSINRTGQGVIEFRRSFVYLENGTIDLVGGGSGGAIVWQTPVGLACPSTTPPRAGCFAPLAAWTNTNQQHSMGGQAALDIAGIFFLPNATPFNLGGQAPQTLTKAQFFVRRLQLSGQGEVRMSPDPGYLEPIELPGLGLIR